jgi:hypothetical protein
MRGVAAWLAALSACASPVLAQGPASEDVAKAKAFTARLIAEAKAEGVFADATSGPAPEARHLSSGVVCRFALARPASIKLLPAAKPGDNVGCTLGRGSGVLALQVQRIPAGVDEARFLADMVQVVQADFPGAESIAAPSADAPAPLKAAHFKASFQGRPVYVGVSALRSGPWMISGHMVAPLNDAAAADRLAEAEVSAAGRASR